MASLPLGIRFLASFTRDQCYRTFMLILTFLLYTAYHLSRKPISIVKSALHMNCSLTNEIELYSYKEHLIQAKLLSKAFSNDTWCSWEPFDKSNYKQLLGALDYSFLCAYAIGMYFSGIIGERLSIRLYLTFGMLSSGLFTALFGLGYFYHIHSLQYYIFIQVINGLVQTTGWPSVVTCVGNWFGKGRRGLIMGIWNSHTSVGNILGSLIAGYWVSSCWGMSFVVPGLIVALMGVVCFLFLIEHPQDVKCTPRRAQKPSKGLNGWDGFKEKCQLYKSSRSVSFTDPEQEYFLKDSDGISAKSSHLLTSHVVVVSSERGNAPAAISFFAAVRIPGVVEFSLCLLFAKLVSYTFLFWLPMYLANKEHFDAKKAGDLSTLFDVGGIIGGILAGVISDHTKKRATTCGVMLLLAAPTLYVFSAIGYMGLKATVVMLIGCGALVNGPYALITTAVSADLGTHKSLMGNSKALSTVTAIIDGTGSIGAALGPLLAGLISPTGWDNVFYMLMVADAFAFLLLIRLVLRELHSKGPKTDQTELKEH
ncbi:glucose-6-phosphate exchanger SLC37A1 isoform X1 [Carcharodon carcharias]|uniref:glucose-6-phosphate exchanger SLC37A1 isoform X1 n=2 Tax=Carcharodon carcharias TaxID=13397 RepID=UPI001B7E8FD5|nr:glucose-6-phosphate exchanger SLC37A1 isoform X1 [Carcharodon carcharias]XP_041067904.1 glucose-6-phosphate exchanger SLC37A1 isoform X1 [Carcharodon carcharias]XP_041067905.1 glucose-6-phosphate exchanger SLC37A1 isoform X1 [Carcharodon carcharias]